MLYFPQLAQFPICKRRVARTVVNDALDGGQVKFSDGNGRRTEWDLTFHGLADAEWSQIATLHKQCEGRLMTFTFIDPTENLLLWSGDFSQTVWSKDPMLQVNGQSIVNGGQASQQLMQTIACPASFQYCFSMLAQSLQGSTMTVVRATATQTQSVSVALTSGWTRVASAGSLDTAEGAVSFGIQLGPGASVALQEMQVEAQGAPSPYHQTGSEGGVHSNARFLDDRLTVQADGPGQSSAVIRIASMGE